MVEGLTLDFGAAIKVVQISKQALMREKRWKAFKASTIIHSCYIFLCVSVFFDQSGVVEHRQYMSAFFFCQPQNKKTIGHKKIHVSLGLVAYSGLFCSEAKVGPAGW